MGAATTGLQIKTQHIKFIDFNFGKKEKKN